jgi:hypothetical protein
VSKKYLVIPAGFSADIVKQLELYQKGWLHLHLAASNAITCKTSMSISCAAKEKQKRE